LLNAKRPPNSFNGRRGGGSTHHDHKVELLCVLRCGKTERGRGGGGGALVRLEELEHTTKEAHTRNRQGTCAVKRAECIDCAVLRTLKPHQRLVVGQLAHVPDLAGCLVGKGYRISRALPLAIVVRPCSFARDRLHVARLFPIPIRLGAAVRRRRARAVDLPKVVRACVVVCLFSWLFVQTLMSDLEEECWTSASH
jgi:hypothetical protein